MDKTFPMLSEHSSAYPYAGNVDVDSSTPTFDYSRWTAGARIRLYSVQWTGDDVVDFGSEAARDAWFNDHEHAAASVILETSANISVDGTIKLPIPFTTLRRYNYAVVDYPTFPVDRADNPIALYAYWIRDVHSAAPSTSIADVRLDEWQTYRYRLTFTRCALDRGHFAVNKAPDVETYLANPLDNADWVRIPEPMAPVAGPRQITARRIYDIWGDEKYVVLGSTAPWKAWRTEIPTPGTVDTVAAPTYKDTENRYGHQYDVTAGFNPAGQDWSNAPGADSITTESPDGRAPALTAIAFKASDVYGENKVLDKLQTAAPWLYESIRAAIIVPESFLTFGTSSDFLGVKAWEVRPAQNPLATLQFTKQSFSYPPECEAWTKLYAFPWALAEVSDDMGHTVEIRIEDCTNATTLNTRCVALFPYVKASAFILGYESRGIQYSYAYSFKRLDGGEARSLFYATNPSEHAFQLDIPTFALWRNSSATKAYDAGADWERAGRHAIADYRNSMRGANTGMENTRDSTATNLANAKASNALALSNATRSADTGLTNANASADTGLANAKASNTVALGNATRSADTGLTNANASADTGLSNAKASNTVALGNAKRSADTGLTNAKASADTARTNIDTQTAAAKKTTDRTNANSTANTKIANDAALYVTSRNNVLNTRQTGDPADAPEGKTPEGSNFWKLNQDYATDNNKMTADWTAANTAAIDSIVPSTVSNAVSGATGVAGSLNGTSQITGAHSSIPQVGATMGIAAGGAAAMAIGAAAAGVIGASIQYGVTLAKNKELIDNNRTQMSEKKDHAQKNMTYMNKENREAATDVTNQQIKAAQDMTANSVQAATDINGYSVAAAKAIGDANKTTAYANAQRARDAAVGNATDTKANADSVATATNATTKANAQRARDAAVTNAMDSKTNADNVATASAATTRTNAKRARDTAVGNATDTRANADNVATASAVTTNANAQYTRNDVSEFAAKTALENARLDLIADYTTAGRTQPTPQGVDSGNNVDMLEWGGAVHVRVRTQPVAVLETAASEFALTGYNAEGRIVDTANTLQVRKHYSYWRGRMWVAPAPGVPFQAIDAIRGKFWDGVTVWSKPEEIGAVDPFAN